jgi:hypothetical protein
VFFTRQLIILFLIFSFVFAFAFEFSVGAFEYLNGTVGYASFNEAVRINRLELGIKHWIFWRAFDFGFYDFPNRITPFNWESKGGWWDVWIKLHLTEQCSVFFLHRSEHNFDGLDFLRIHWYNFFGIEFNW